MGIVLEDGKRGSELWKGSSWLGLRSGLVMYDDTFFSRREFDMEFLLYIASSKQQIPPI
jgi:hypothetical protein